MTYGKIKIDSTDQIFSEIIRKKAEGKCQRCLRPHEWIRLQCAHFHGRANRRVRWDLDNACGLCYGCHAYLDSRAMEKVDFFLKRLGKENFKKLNQRANWKEYKKVDKRMVELFLKTKLRQINAISDPSAN